MESSGEFSSHNLKGHALIELESVTSTNMFLQLLLNKGSAEQGLIVKAAFQGEGKGMSKNSWFSEKGKNLLMSMLHYSDALTTQKQFFISKCCAIGVAKAIDRMIGVEMSHIKWPNDVYINSKKVAGILIQSSIKGDNIQYSLLGIGVNINQNQFPLENATSIMLETGQKFELAEFLSYLIEELDASLDKLSEFNYESINNVYYKKLIGYQKWLRYKKDDELFDGRILTIEDDGHLLMEMKNGEKQHFAVKEISLVPAGTNGQPTY